MCLDVVKKKRRVPARIVLGGTNRPGWPSADEEGLRRMPWADSTAATRNQGHLRRGMALPAMAITFPAPVNTAQHASAPGPHGPDTRAISSGAVRYACARAVAAVFAEAVQKVPMGVGSLGHWPPLASDEVRCKFVAELRTSSVYNRHTDSAQTYTSNSLATASTRHTGCNAASLVNACTPEYEKTKHEQLTGMYAETVGNATMERNGGHAMLVKPGCG
ncbi:hypothetical protein BJ912DRAFT_1041434 [Pholiota molesta]|nr:hypothetical protein BJ912DRAFT_1041434 [Pholiota molesta]